jgi:hypothetical protein
MIAVDVVDGSRLVPTLVEHGLVALNFLLEHVETDDACVSTLETLEAILC